LWWDLNTNTFAYFIQHLHQFKIKKKKLQLLLFETTRVTNVYVEIFIMYTIRYNVITCVFCSSRSGGLISKTEIATLIHARSFGCIRPDMLQPSCMLYNNIMFLLGLKTSQSIISVPNTRVIFISRTLYYTLVLQHNKQHTNSILWPFRYHVYFIGL